MTAAGDIVTVSGDKSAVEKALQLIDDLLHPKYEAESTFELAAADVPLVIGRKGVTGACAYIRPNM